MATRKRHSPEQIVQATLDEAQTASEAFGLPVPTSDELRKRVVESVFDEVPPGGDAAFAAAVCNEVNAGVWKAITAQGTPEQALAATPHLLRGSGRQVCASLGEKSYPKVEFKKQEEAVKEAKHDPAAYKSTQLEQLRDQLEKLKANVEKNPKLYRPGAVESMQDTIASVESTSAEEIVKNLAAMLRMQWLAIEHECPSRSRYGFGPGCGQFDPFPDGSTTGVLRVREGNLSCHDAQTAIRFHYFPTTADPDSPLLLFLCREGGLEKVEDAPLYIECEAIQGNPNPARIVVAPA